jgi:DNA-binding SARP family transcriptional activator
MSRIGTREPALEWSAKDETALHRVAQLLLVGQYEQAAELLHEMQLNIEHRGDAIAAQVLVLARRLCLACSQSQAETKWHQQACEEANRREQKLRQQLGTLLDLVDDERLSSTPPWEALPSTPPVQKGLPAPDQARSVEHLSLWQRLQDALLWRMRRHSLADLASEMPAEADVSATFSTESTERLTVPPEQAGGPFAIRAEEAVAQAPLVIEQTQAPAAPAVEETKAQAPTALAIQEKEEQALPDQAMAPTSSPITAGAREKGKGTPSLVVYCLGPFQVYQDEQPVEDWPSSKGKSVFKYLVTHRERPIAKEVLMELLWPSAPPDAARNSLNVAIYGLRQALRKTHPHASHILFQDDCYQLDPDLQIWTDVDAFLEHLAAARRLEHQGDLTAAIGEYHAAEALYQGDFLEQDPYEDWPIPQRQRLQRDYLDLLNRLSRFYLDRTEHAACATVCRKMLTIDSCCEQAHRRLMCCYSRQGQPYLALRQYHLCVDTLRNELDVNPTSDTTKLYEHIRRHQPV